MNATKIANLLSIHDRLVSACTLPELWRPDDVGDRLNRVQEMIMEEIDPKKPVPTDDDIPF